MESMNRISDRLISGSRAMTGVSKRVNMDDDSGIDEGVLFLRGVSHGESLGYERGEREGKTCPISSLDVNWKTVCRREIFRC